MTDDTEKSEYERLLPEAAEALEINGYRYSQQELLHEVARPFNGGWVSTLGACFQRRTKGDFIKMFTVYKGQPAFDLLGFRDLKEGMLCEQAAIETGSAWRFMDFYKRDKSYGKSGLGTLNIALQDYADGYIAGLFPEEFPPPERGKS